MRFAGLKRYVPSAVRKVLSAEVERLQAASAHRTRSDQLAANDRASSKDALNRVRLGALARAVLFIAA
jgi:hypothetical protein